MGLTEEPAAVAGTGNFIHSLIREDLGADTSKIATRFPPEPNGYLHIGHAKSILLNFGLAKYYGGTFNLRFDDTNPAKEDTEYVDAIIEDVRWLGADWEGRLFFASDYFDKFYECAVLLIKKGLAYVCELTPPEIKEYRGTLNSPGKESPYRGRSAAENLDLFERMKNGEFPDGSKTLRAKIDMASPNINLRDPVIYRIARITHHNTGDRWCVYPMYDFAHPLEDAIEGITHSICTMEFEDHRPLYDWCVNNIDLEAKPRQIEFAKLSLTNTIMGKRYMKALVDSGEVDGWDDPRLATISGFRRRGYTADAIRAFCEQIGVSKADNRVEIAMLEHAVREDLKGKANVVMAVADPLKVTITNYPDGQTEELELENHPENADAGTRTVTFSKHLYVERGDFMEDAPSKFFRLSVGREVRFKGAYFIKCDGVVKDESGAVTELLCSYDPETKSGSGFEGRKVKGTIHWVNAEDAIKIRTRAFDYLVYDDSAAEDGFVKNDNTVTVLSGFAEKCLESAKIGETFQFMRSGYYCKDKTSTEALPVFNQTVALKSSFKI